MLHIGPTKTGSSSIQHLLWKNETLLHADGVFLPGSRQPDHFRIGNDIRGLRPARDNHLGNWKGTYQSALRSFEESSCHTMVISDENLALTSRARAAAAVERAGDLDVEVVYCLRELSALLVSQWQGRVRNGIADPLEGWLSEIRDRVPGNRFWAAHDAPEVLDRWVRAGCSRIHLLTLPGTGAPKDALWRRFEAATGWATDTDPTARPSNETLGLVEIDLMRRIQANYVGEKLYVRRPVLNSLVFRQVLAERPNDVPILLPPGTKEWVRSENERRIGFATSGDVELHGDIADLEVTDRRFGDSEWEGHEADQRDAAVAVIVRLTDEIIRLRRELRKANRRLGAAPQPAGLGSQPVAGTSALGARHHLVMALRSLRWPSWVPRPKWLGRSDRSSA